MNDIVPDTVEKALVNLNPLKYGTVVEVGAGCQASICFRPDRWPGIPSPAHAIEFGSHGENNMAMIEHPVPYEYEGSTRDGSSTTTASPKNARQYICSQTG